MDYPRFLTILRRRVVKQFAEPLPREGVNPCRLAVQPLYFAVIGYGVALVVGRRCGRQSPTLR